LEGQDDDELHVCEDEATAIKLTELFAMREACKLLASGQLEPGFNPKCDLVEWMNQEQLITTLVTERYIIGAMFDNTGTVVSADDDDDDTADFPLEMCAREDDL
jgi:hypothetical protein